MKNDLQMSPFNYTWDTTRGIFEDARASRVPDQFDGSNENEIFRAVARSEFNAP